jgi:hypothetical protein
MPQGTECPLCRKRAARRECPAKAAKICSICCGTHREVEIDCPSECPHLATGRSWEAGRTPPVSAASGAQFSEPFLRQHGAVIMEIAESVAAQRASFPALVDADVRLALDALLATVRTLESGLYYETRPEGSLAAASLYTRLRGTLEEWMAPPRGERGSLKVSSARSILEFFIAACEIHRSDRPKSRRYLDWLSRLAPAPNPEGEPGRLILP